MYIDVSRLFRDDGTPLEFGSPESIDRNKAGNEERDRLLREAARLQRRIADLNQQYLPRLLEQIPPEKASEVRQVYRAAAYPRVFPDSEDPEPLYKKLVKSKALTSDQREALGAIWKNYRTGYDSLNSKMVDEYDAWCDHNAKTGRFEYDHWGEVRRLREERWTSSLRVIEQLTNSAPPDVQTELSKAIKQQRLLIDEAMRRQHDHTDLGQP